MSMKGLQSRRLAVEILLKVEQEGVFAGAALAAGFKNHALSEKDRALVTCIVQGSLRHQLELDEELKKLVKKDLSKLSPKLRVVLRAALFQLIHLSDMPESAIINTAVEIARKTGHEGSAKFANAVLRNFQRKRLSESKSENENNQIAENKKNESYSVPDWLRKRWLERFGASEAELLFAFTQSVPVLHLRSCELAITPEGLAEILSNKGMKIEKSRIAPTCIKVLERGKLGGPVNKMPGYEEGLFCVQDETSTLAGEILNPQPGQTLVDLCAAPGGKTLHLAEKMQNRGRVIAVDASKARLALIGKERARLGLANIETVHADGRTYEPGMLVDAVLVDAPCSGTGVMNRRSDLRIKRQEKDINALVEIQEALLENAASMIKPGGVIVYSTCSIEKEENQELVKCFLEKHPEFQTESIEGYFQQELLEKWQNEAHWAETQKELESGYIQLLPSRHGSSGFFIFKASKTRDNRVL